MACLVWASIMITGQRIVSKCDAQGILSSFFSASSGVAIHSFDMPIFWFHYLHRFKFNILGGRVI